MKNNLKPNQTQAFFFAGEEIGDYYDISMSNIYNYSTITTYINYKCK